MFCPSHIKNYIITGLVSNFVYAAPCERVTSSLQKRNHHKCLSKWLSGYCDVIGNKVADKLLGLVWAFDKVADELGGLVWAFDVITAGELIKPLNWKIGHVWITVILVHF